jgi:predicted methyltransferase
MSAAESGYVRAAIPGAVGVAAIAALVALCAGCNQAHQAAPQQSDNPPAEKTAKETHLFPAADLGLIEPPDRDQWQQPEQIMDDLGIADGAVVADLGAGGGWFTVQLAHRIGPQGIVYAVDVQREMIELVRRRAQRERLFNIRTILGSAADPLPTGLDVALAVSVYHEMACAQKPRCEEPVGVLKNVARSLKAQGRLGVVDFYPGEGGPGPAPEERVDEETVIKTAASAGLQLLMRKAITPFRYQYLLVFGKMAALKPE